MTHFNFYVQHALRDLRRNGRRTAFALFCVAAGVAAIVALRSLSLMIADSLSGNLASINHGDMRIASEDRENNSFGNSLRNDGRQVIPADTLKVIEQWAAEHNIQTTNVISDANISVAPLDNTQNVGRPQFLDSYVIDPAVYPFYGPIRAVDPPDKPLAELFTGGNEVVISKNFADANHVKVGDQVRVGRTTELFTVRGIVPTEADGNLRHIFGAFFGFAYFNKAQTSVFQLDPLPDAIYMLAPQGANLDALKESLNQTLKDAQKASGQTDDPGLSITTLQDVRKQNQTIADILDRLIIVMGLAALLIGSTGIIHTMLVVVSRRTVEIAVLKTLGLQGRQITLMFLIESIIMGILGSVFGVVLGIILSIGVRSFFQSSWPQSLEWHIYPEAMITGFLLGVIITAVFGFLPTITAAAVRPALVLRPNESMLPTAGCFPVLVTLLFVVAAIGLIAGQLIGNLLLGMIAIVIASVLMTVAVVLLYLLIALIGRFPAFGWVDLRLAIRGINTHRARTASTLLALIVGVLSLSVITLMAQSVPRLLNVQFTKAFGGNVMVFELLPAFQRPFVIAQLKDQPGVSHYNQVGLYMGKLIAVNGDRDWADKVKVQMPMMNFGSSANATNANSTDANDSNTTGTNTSPANTNGGFGNRRPMDNKTFLQQALGSVGALDVASSGYLAPRITSGRDFTPQDAGQRNVLMQNNPFTLNAGLKVGDSVTFEFNNQEVTFTVIGTTNAKDTSMANGSAISNSGTFTAPVDAFPAGMNPMIEFTLASVDEAHLNQILVNLSTIPGVFPFDVGFFETLIKRLLEQFTAIPTIVAVLSLFAGAVIIANTVSLTTLERRRQVGIMKAIGLPSRRVLLQMVIENGLIGLLGGIIGVGIGIVITLLLSINSQIPITESISWGTVGLLMALSLLISMIATLLSAWTATSEKPLNVLRYE